jgi:hypothetical protein
LRALFFIFMTMLLIFIGACNDDTPLDPVVDPIRVPLVKITGSGTDCIGAVEITDSVGYCDINGERIPAVVYWTQVWEDYDLVATHIIAPQGNDVHVLFLYSADDTLRTIWHESYTAPLKSEKISGGVVFSGRSGLLTPDLQCLETVPDVDPLVADITIAGPTLNWSDDSGLIEIDDQSFDWYPFQFVDCGDCGNTEAEGWYELHAIFRGPQNEMEFGILYLHKDEPGQVALHYRFRFCDLRLGSPVFYKADWALESSGSSFQSAWQASY